MRQISCCLALLLLTTAAAAHPNRPHSGPLYLCHAPMAGTAADSVLAWQGEQSVVVQPTRERGALPAYLAAEAGAVEWGAPAELHDTGRSAWLRLSATLVMDCERTFEE